MALQQSEKPDLQGSGKERTMSSESKTGRDHDPELRQEEVVTNAPHVDVPPDGGYGWVCVAAVAIINAHTWGVNSVSLSRPSFYL